MIINLDDYICAGYYIITLHNVEKTLERDKRLQETWFSRHFPTLHRYRRSVVSNIDKLLENETGRLRREQFEADLALHQQLLPTTFCTLSHCFTDSIPDIGWKLTNPEPFGIAEPVIEEIDDDLQARFMRGEVGHTRTWYSLDYVRDFIGKFGDYIHNAVLFGAAMHKSLLDDFEEFEAFHHEGSALQKNGGFVVIDKQLPVDESGQILGYDVVGYDLDIHHSMACYHLVEEAYKGDQIKPNQYGLYDTFEEAEKCAYYANYGNELGYAVGDCAWYPLLILQYPLSEITK